MKNGSKTKSRLISELDILRSLMAMTSDYVYKIVISEDSESEIEWIEGDFEDVTGHEIKSFVKTGRFREDVVHPDDRRLLDSMVKRVLSGSEEKEEFRIFTKEGSLKWLEVSERPEFDPENGEVTARLGAVQDITAVVEAEHILQDYRERLEDAVDARNSENRMVIEELRKEVEERRKVEVELEYMNELLESFFSTVHLMIAYMDRDFNFIQVNKPYAESNGHDRDYFKGKNHFDIHPDGENVKLFRRVLETGEPHTVYGRRFTNLNHDNGPETFWDWSLYPIKSQEGEVEGLVLYMLDVTDRELMRHELERQRAQSIHADRLRSLGEMAAGISHELNQPLMGIRNMAEHLLISLRRGWEVSPEDLAEKAKDIISMADRMTQVIEHTRDFARGGGERQTARPVSVNEVIDDAVSLGATQMKSRGVEFRIVTEEDLPPVIVNPYSLEEVIFNLVNNARDAVLERMERGKGPSSPIITVESGVEERVEGRFVTLTVTDQGGGMSDEALKRAFEPFFSTKEPGKGTGLGLSICRSIIENMNGEIELSTEPGTGTTVKVLIPPTENDDAAEENT